MGKKIIFYELNEVPWRLVDWYCGVRPQSTLKRLMNESACFTTVTRDQGELHPWSTWPSLHRGCYNDRHKIFFLNQDKSHAEEFPPIWEVLAQKGIRVGVFGCLQSYPMKTNVPYSFYVPDTFAPTEQTYPKRYSAFQRLNLRQTQRDGALPTNVQVDGKAVFDLIKMKATGLKTKTATRIAWQLIQEKIKPIHRTRRSILQAPVAFDFFMDALKRERPEFCSFFTNHVAGMMHRYWKYVFPEDFNYSLSSEEDFFHKNTLCVAMDVADEELGRLDSFSKENGYDLVVASSMGQEAIHKPPYLGEMRIKDFDLFYKAIGYYGWVENRLAMHPDFSFIFQNQNDLQEFKRRVEVLLDSQGNSLFNRIRLSGLSLTIGITKNEDILKSGQVCVMSQGQQRMLSLKELGLDLISRDEGTGYHQPFGILIWKKYTGDNNRFVDSSRSEVESASIAPTIAQCFGVKAKSHLFSPIELH